jgi:chemotaxis methyl-accepting protein methylase
VTEHRPVYSLPLAHGELSAQDAQELRALKDQIKRDIGFYCEAYKELCLRRRIAVRMRACSIHTYAEYGTLLERDQGEHHKLLDAITINVSKFYRNRELWHTLEREVVPRLFDLQARRVRVCSAGCAAGEEPYTIAMMLKEYARATGRQKDLRKFDVVGVDVDRGSLRHALAGRYGAFAFTDIDAATRSSWFQGPELTEIKPDIRAFVRFQEQDLMKEDLEPGQHMIVCRNVIIYFERSVQEMLFMKFHEALAPGGFLVLGKVESIFGRAAGLFKPIVQRDRVFVKA